MAAKKKAKGKKAQRQNSPASQNSQQQQDQSSGSNNKPAHSASAPAKSTVKGEDLIHISPSRIRFQHSKIRPLFSGCGRSVMETLEEIRRGDLEPADLPPIQVLIGPAENDGLGPWYFSLNNRRLWVLKQCYKEGLLDNERYNNTIAVRVRMPKSGAEAERYSVQNCALEAKFMREGSGGGSKKNMSNGKRSKKSEKATILKSETDNDSNNFESEHGNVRIATESDEEVLSSAIETKLSLADEDEKDKTISEDSSCESDDSDEDIAHDNPFSALF